VSEIYLVFQVNGARFEWPFATAQEATQAEHRLLADAVRDGKSIDACDVMGNCHIHGWGPLWEGQCEACFDEDYRAFIEPVLDDMEAIHSQPSIYLVGKHI
jgi:hypothetical protein